MTLRLERDGAIARLLIDRPARRNAMNQAMWEEMPRLVGAAMADDAVRVLILASAAPGLFCGPQLGWPGPYFSLCRAPVRPPRSSPPPGPPPPPPTSATRSRPPRPRPAR